jgi:hypothetical protein
MIYSTVYVNKLTPLAPWLMGQRHHNCFHGTWNQWTILCGRAYLSHLTKYNQYLIDMSLSDLLNRSEEIVYRLGNTWFIPKFLECFGAFVVL